MVQEAELVDSPPKRGLSLGPIIAIVCVLILITAGVFFLFWDPGVKQITLVSPKDLDSDSDLNLDSMRIEFGAIMDGIQKLDEKVQVVIDLEGDTVYTASIAVKEENFFIDIRYDSFITGNGIYKIRASVGSAKAETEYRVSFVAQNVNATLQESLDPDTGELRLEVIVQPIFTNSVAWNAWDVDDHDEDYKLMCSVAEPDATVTQYDKTMAELPGNYSESFEVPGSLMGEYTATVTIENLMVKPDSPYRIVQAERAVTEFVNRPPVIEELRVPSRVSRNQEMQLICTANDQDSNGGLTAFAVDWGEVDKNDYAIIQEFNLTGDPMSYTLRTNHVYAKAGNYNITVSAIDNGPMADPTVPGTKDEVRLASRFVIINVRLI